MRMRKKLDFATVIQISSCLLSVKCKFRALAGTVFACLKLTHGSITQNGNWRLAQEQLLRIANTMFLNKFSDVDSPSNYDINSFNTYNIIILGAKYMYGVYHIKGSGLCYCGFTELGGLNYTVIWIRYSFWMANLWVIWRSCLRRIGDKKYFKRWHKTPLIMLEVWGYV